MKKLKTSFSGHDKFDCKIDWVVQGLSAFYENNTIFMHSNIEKSISNLGLGINMIKSLSHWMKALGLIKNNDLTKLGEIILDKDPYLENDNTLWLLHWNLTKRQENTTLYRGTVQRRGYIKINRVREPLFPVTNVKWTYAK